jgi:hypothetical protein
VVDPLPRGDRDARRDVSRACAAVRAGYAAGARPGATFHRLREKGDLAIRHFGVVRAASLAVVALLIVGITPAGALSKAQFPVQSVGDSGTDVLALQRLLRGRGHDVPVNGHFAAATRDAVAGYQRSVGLAVTGVANVSTWQAIVPTLAHGSSGEAVLALKELLNAKRGAGLSLSANFESATRGAVRTFQRHVGLADTGTVNTETWRNLVWHFERPAYGLASLCNYNGGNRSADWGTASTVASLEAAAGLFRSRTGGVVAVGDISFEHGGDIRYHSTHEHGLDIDLALIRRDARQCANPGISYKHAQYDRAATRAMLRALHETLGNHLKLIYFNDPQLVSEGLSVRYPNHDDHVHVRVCEAGHALARYVC